ncbi:MAG: pilus assembly protein PilM [Deltaproteobacteria bacterium]
MAGINDINSTEKLLNVIRGKDKESFASKGKSAVPLFTKKPGKKTNLTLPKLFFNKKRYTVGIDISEEFIGLAKTKNSSDGRPLLVDHKIIKYDHLTSKDSVEFKSLLKSYLIDFCGSLTSCNIWTMISATDVNVNHIKIPRVPRKQQENVIYWTAKKENPVDEKEFVFDFEMQGEISDQGIPKYLVMVYTVPKFEVDKVKAFYTEMGITLSGISIAPFAIQNMFCTKWMKVSEETFASLYIGIDFSRIDIYNKKNLVITRGIKTGINSMTEEIAEAIGGKADKANVSRDEARKILFSLGDQDASELGQTDIGFDLKDEDKFKMIIPVLERLSRQIERTLEHYVSTIGTSRVEKLYISLVMNVYDPMLNYISDQLGIKADYLDPFGQQFAYAAADSMKLSEKVSLVTVLGLSFSDNSRTPNAIFNYREKNREMTVKRINRGIFASFAAALIICFALITYQIMEATNQSIHLKALKKELSLYDPLLSTEKISTLMKEVKANKQISRQYAQKHLDVATIGEISVLTPDNIHLISLKINTGNSTPKENPDKAAKEINDDVVIEGVVSGERDMLDSFLAQYVMKLENSPMLRQFSVQKSSIMKMKKGEVLYFTLSGKIG